MNIQIIGVPMFYGCDNKGTEIGFYALSEKGLASVLENCGHKITKTTVIDVPEVSEDTKFEQSAKMKYLKPILDVCKQLEIATASAIKDGDFPLIIGGDHAISIGSVAGSGRIYNEEDLSVIWVDAHTDINTDETSDSFNVHGMPLSASMGIGNPVLTSFGGHRVKVKPKNTYIVGARSIDKPEQELIEKEKINCITIETVHKNGIEKTVSDILSKITTNHIHLSFDVDGLDGDLFTATGLPVKNGYTINEAAECLSLILKSGKVCTFDIVEYSPKHDKNDEGLKVVLEIISKVFCSIKA